MTTGAIVFMTLSWTFVLGLAGFSYFRILSNPRQPGSRDDEPPAGV